MPSRSERARRVRVLVERHKKRAGYKIWHRGGLIGELFYNESKIDRRMGAKRQSQWWLASINPKTFTITLLQPLIRPTTGGRSEAGE